MDFQHLALRLTDWFRTVRDIERLRDIDDRLLADMGIDRPEIAARVKGGRRR